MKAARLTKRELKSLDEHVEGVDAKLRKRFEKSYRAWRKTWEIPAIAISPNPAHRTHTPAFVELISLGLDVLPLLIEKLTHVDEFFALQAVDRLLQPKFIVRWEPNNPAVLLGEQHRALLTVKRWIRRADR